MLERVLYSFGVWSGSGKSGVLYSLGFVCSIEWGGITEV
jgi:hypothetical protein